MQLLRVILDIPTNSFSEPFNYCVEDELGDKIEVGSAVLVTFNNREEVGFVVEKRGCASEDDGYSGVREVLSEPYFDETKAELLQWIAHKYISSLSSAIRLGLPASGTPRFVRHKDGTRTLETAARRPKKYNFRADEVAACSKNYKRPEELTSEQQNALDVINNSPAGHAILIDGVTGSGKTEVYLQAIEKVIAEGKTAIVLVPEIALTPQTVARFESRFPGVVAVMHSKMTTGERRQQWYWIREGNAKIVIGARSALFAPLDNIGMVVIDEEHETSYKQDSSPRYHAREVAKKLVEIVGGKLVLGDATPSIDALYLAKHDPDWTRLELTRRATGMKLPRVEIVNMSDLPKGGRFTIFSNRLKEAIVHELKAAHKVVLLLNQRGFSKFLLCQDCGFVPQCPNCSTSLTFHEAGNVLKCHHCGYVVPTPPRCPECGSVYLQRIGYGTQRVEAEVRELVNEAFANSPLDAKVKLEDIKIVRMDADTTEKAHSHEKLLREFDEAKSAVLLGTQMIAKGLDFDDVTLVGVVNADTTMHVPDFRAAERTYDLIEQVSGRCGRTNLPGLVIVQTYEPDNAALRAAMTHDREMFLRVELPKRKVLKFPPYVNMINVVVWSADKEEAEAETQKIAADLRELFKDYTVDVLGGSSCPFEKIQSSWRFHVLMRFGEDEQIEKITEDYFRSRRKNPKVNVVADVHPIDLL